MEMHGRSKQTIIVGTFLALALIAAGVFLYAWMRQSSEVSRLQESSETNERTIAALREEIADKQGATADSGSAGDESTTKPEVGDDSEAIVAMTGAYARARVDAATARLAIEVMKKDASFARVSVNTEDVGGYMCVLKKVDELWVVLFCGQSPPLQTELDQWGVPEAILQS